MPIGSLWGGRGRDNVGEHLFIILIAVQKLKYHNRLWFVYSSPRPIDKNRNYCHLLSKILDNGPPSYHRGRYLFVFMRRLNGFPYESLLNSAPS